MPARLVLDLDGTVGVIVACPPDGEGGMPAAALVAHLPPLAPLAMFGNPWCIGPRIAIGPEGHRELGGHAAIKEGPIPRIGPAGVLDLNPDLAGP